MSAGLRVSLCDGDGGGWGLGWEEREDTQSEEAQEKFQTACASVCFVCTHEGQSAAAENACPGSSTD